MKKLTFVALFCIANISIAQIKIQGVVKDSIGDPLELANVNAINQETRQDTDPDLNRLILIEVVMILAQTIQLNTTQNIKVQSILLGIDQDQMIHTRESPGLSQDAPLLEETEIFIAQDPRVQLYSRKMEM